MSAQVAADLRAAADVLERDGWTQGSYRDHDGGHCQGGALLAGIAPGAAMSTWSLPLPDLDRWESAERFLGSFLNLPEDASPLRWNDEPGRTADEVIAALRAAADRAEVDQ